MASINGWDIALLFIVAYAVAVYLLYRAGFIGPDRVLSLYGPALMIKTKRGRGFLDRVAQRRRLWTVLADLGIVLAAIAMVVVVGLLILDAIVVSRLPPGSGPSPQMALGIPGLNPIIPLGYGLVALIVGVVLHELFHGFVARSQKIGVKSIGILWCVIPVGAFVEQDDAEMNQAPRRQRDRVAAAGVLANFGLAVLFFFLLAAVMSTSVQPNANGVGVTYVVAGTPAQNASLTAGDIITQLNGTPTPTNTALFNALAKTHAGQSVSLTYYSTRTSGLVSTTVPLAPLSMETHLSSDAQKAFLGVAPAFLTPVALKEDLTSPLTSSAGPLYGTTDWLVLPLAGLEPVSGSTVSFYHLTGPLAGTDPGLFWVGANLLYWLSWMNLLLGLSNALPLFPLDGGLLFRDFSATLASRARKGWDANRLDRFGSRAAAASSIIVLGLLVWQFVGPSL